MGGRLVDELAEVVGVEAVGRGIVGAFGRPPLTFRKADPSDFEAVEHLRLEATAWLASKGLDQWQPGTVRHPTPAGTQDAIGRGACFLVYEGDELVGTVTIDDRADAEFWTADERREPALYLHRMIVARSAAGRDIGGAILRWAENIARRGGYRWLRLDAWKPNPSLHDYYSRRGFTHVRTVDLPHRGSGALFERVPSGRSRTTGSQRAGAQQVRGNIG